MSNVDCKSNTSLYAMELACKREMNRKFINAVEMLEFRGAGSVLVYYDIQINALPSRSEIISSNDPIYTILDSCEIIENALHVLHMILDAYGVDAH
ncbi:MAG: hypothetical protein CMJ42_03220 [Phyllobacteriaceae bacterium]|nr:hypothetical protein [Phyllobacteriaceae bacterium]MBA93016.1 hypothetical protein [Phyllobacteriaceae bacterium]